MPDSIGIGHNQPTSLDAGDPEILRARLAREHSAALARFAELELGIAQIPAEIATEGEAQKVVDFIAQQCRPLTDAFKKAHAKEKRPYLAAGRAVDDFFLRRIEAFNRLLGPVSRRAELYFQRKKEEQRRREEQQRRKAETERRRQQEEADRLRAEAAVKEAAGEREAAIPLAAAAQVAQEDAAAAQAVIDAPPAPVRIHGDYGAAAFAKTRWTFEVEDPALIPLGYLTIDENAVTAAIADGVREIPGLRIYQTEQFIIRRC